VPSKKMPPPQYAFLYGTLNDVTGKGGFTSPETFKRQKGIGLKSPDGFVFGQINYTVKSFKVEFSGKGFNGIETVRVNNTDGFSSIRSYIERCDAGTTINITEIIALDAGGQDQLVASPIHFTIK
jgi:hypothetical protein